MNFTNFSLRHKPQIEAYLSALFSSYKFDDSREDLKQAVIYSLTAKAKRIRPLICLAAFLLYEDEKQVFKILPLAAALELIHTYSLIHDDLPAMDNDDFRRGRLTCHKKFGEDLAILAGDTLNTFAFELLSRELGEFFDARKVLKIIHDLAYALGIFGMAGGQALDLKAAGKKFDLAYLKKTHECKTGALIAASLSLPAFLVCQRESDLTVLTEFGEHLGLLFQIVDDILDVSGTKENLGKSVKKDIYQKKMTYVTLLGLEKARALAEAEAEKARDNINKLTVAAAKKEVLFDLADFILNRSA